jgi:hypothetical protein
MEMMKQFEEQMRQDEERGLLPKGYTDKMMESLK